MSFKRGLKPPARPPPPRGGLSLGGMSFKKLEDEEEEEDLTISDKYTSLLTQTRSSAPASFSISGKGGTLSLVDTKNDPPSSEAEDGEKSSPLRKGKSKFEILSGLKGKIQEKIHEKIQDKLSKTTDDMSGESSASASPDKEQHPASGLLGEGTDLPPSAISTGSLEGPVTRESIATVNSSCPEATVQPTSMPQLARQGSEEKPADSGERCSTTRPVQLSAQMEDDENGEEKILVFEEHFKEEPFEDFTGGLTTSTAVRSRSRLKPLKKKTPKTMATVSMLGLMKTPTAEQDSQKLDKSKKRPERTDQSSDSSSLKQSPAASLMRLVNQEGQALPWSKFVAAVSCLFAYLIVPLPSYLSGLIAGCLMTTLMWVVYLWLMQPPPIKEAPKLTPIEDLPPMEIPEMKDPTLEDGVYKGWMNEITNYNPNDYHINHTYSVFITLEGSRLRLQRPKTPVPKRAMHDENLGVAHFIHQRHFDLTGSRVFLQPQGLVKKRVWSKKYPICLALAEAGTKIKNEGDSSVDGPPSAEGAKSDMGFELISEEKCESNVLFLFARTGREKEEWFRRFTAATQGKSLANPVLEMRRAIERYRQSHHRRANSDGSTRQRHNSTDSQSSTASDPAENGASEAESWDPTLDFTRYMGHLMPAGAFSRLLSPSKDKELGAAPRLPFSGSIICDSQLYWLNAVIGRCFYDFLRDTWWTEKIKDKLQRKLSKIHVPYFIEELQVTAIDMGKEMPVIRRAANPYLDERGFWVELDISYGGGFQMTIETKMNLMKLKRNHPKTTTNSSGTSSERSPVTDSDEEDSAESSTDEEEEPTPGVEEKESGGGSKKLLKYLDKLTSSKYFQQATEYKYIKRAMENVSNTPLQLQVSVRNLVGKLAINIPPPPSDRLWYGFRGAPRLWLVAKPQVGERVVTITHVTEWIERKLELEFQRVFVMPNMDDLVVPILRPSQDGTPLAEEMDKHPTDTTSVL